MGRFIRYYLINEIILSVHITRLGNKVLSLYNKLTLIKNTRFARGKYLIIPDKLEAPFDEFLWFTQVISLLVIGSVPIFY